MPGWGMMAGRARDVALASLAVALATSIFPLGLGLLLQTGWRLAFVLQLPLQVLLWGGTAAAISWWLISRNRGSGILLSIVSFWLGTSLGGLVLALIFRSTASPGLITQLLIQFASLQVLGPSGGAARPFTLFSIDGRGYGPGLPVMLIFVGVIAWFVSRHPRLTSASS